MATKGLEKLVLKKRVLSFGEFINSPKQFETGKAVATDNKVKSEAGDKDINKMEKATKSLSEAVDALTTEYTLEQLEAVIEAKLKGKAKEAFLAKMAGKKPDGKGEKKDKEKDCVEEGKGENLEADTKQFSDAKKSSIPTKPTADEAGKPGNSIQKKQGMATLPGKK